MMEGALEAALANPGLGLLLLNEDNRSLAEDVERLRQEVSRADDVWREQTDTHSRNTARVADMTQMLDNMQALVRAHRQDVDAETKQEREASSEAEGVLRLCRQRQADLGLLHDTSQQLETHARQRKREMDELHKDLSGDTSLLEELLEELTRAEDDNLMLLQYSADDVSKIKELSVALERTSGSCAAAECELAAAQGETLAAQAVLDQLGAAFVSAAAHRDQLLAHWETTLTHLFHTATNHTYTIQDCLSVQEKLGIIKHEVDQEMEILTEVERSCGEVVARRNIVEEEAKWISSQLQSSITTAAEIQAEVWGLENALCKLNKLLEAHEIGTKQQRELIAEKESWLASLYQRYSSAHDNLSLNSELLMSTQDTLHSLQAMLKEAEGNVEALMRQKKRVAEAEQQHRCAVSQWREHEASVKGEISAFTATKTRHINHSRDLKNQQQKLNELLHKQEIEIEALRQRLHALTHDQNNNEADPEQPSRLEILQRRLHSTTTTIATLTRQLTTLKTVRGREQGSVRELEKTRDKLESDLATVKMNTTSAEREQVKLSGCREEVRVEVSLLQLHLQRQVKRLQSITNRAVHLTQHKADVKRMVEDQMEGVKERMKGSEREVRGLEGELHRLTLQLHNVTSTINHLRDKYDKIKSSLDTAEGEEVSTTQVFLKVESERAGLQEAGDLLDGEVRQAEAEVDALQQMVALLSTETQQYRSTLHNIVHYSEEERERVELEESLGALDEETMVWQAVLDEEQGALRGAEARQREVCVQVSAVEELLREKSVHLRAVERETHSHRTMAAHATRAITTLTKRTRIPQHIHSDIELRIGAERLRMVHSLLGEAVSCHPEATQAAMLYCQQASIPPLTLPSLSRRDAYGSRSSLGSMQSSRSSSSSNGSRKEDRGRSVSPGQRRWWRRDSSRRSSLSSARSHDSGRSGSPQHPSTSPAPSPSTLTQPHAAKITLITPAFPSTEQRRSKYQGKKLYKRPTVPMK